MDLGATALANGDDVEAARVFRLAADTWGTNHPRYADAIEALAETRTTQGMLEDALALGSEALAQLRVTKGANNPRVTEALLKVSAHHEALGDVPAALEAAVEATTIAAIAAATPRVLVRVLTGISWFIVVTADGRDALGIVNGLRFVTQNDEVTAKPQVVLIAGGSALRCRAWLNLQAGL